jgi:hypothetical protein
MCARPLALALLLFPTAFALESISVSAAAQDQVLGWGGCWYGECTAPTLPPGVTFVELAAGEIYSVARLSDGTIVTWGASPSPVPALPEGVTYVRVAASDSPPHILAVRSDGQVVAWGENFYGECDVPPLPPGLTYVEVATGRNYSLARRSDGSVVGWGLNAYGQCDAPPLPPGLAYVEIAAGTDQSLARRSDGSVVAWGSNLYGECNVPALAPGLSYVEIAAGMEFSVARRSDGTVVAWGQCYYGYCNVPALPPGVAYIDLSTSMNTILARRSDGSAVGWGICGDGNCNVPTLPPGQVYLDVAAGGQHSIGLVGPAPACGSTSYYCWPAAANSVNPAGASLSVDGCPGLTANNLVLSVTGLPPGGPGIFFYGSQPRFTANGIGYTCVGGSVRRILPPVFADGSGTVALPLDLTHFPFSGSAQSILPGSTWNFQYWYRDPAGSQSTYNFSDACHVVFAP